MNIIRRDDEFGTELRISFTDDAVMAHRVFAPAHQYDYEKDAQVCPQVRVSPLGLTGGAPIEWVVQHASELLQVAGAAQALQAEINAKWDASKR